MAELLLRDEGRLRASADMQPPILTTPGDGTVGLEVNVLNARGRIGHVVHCVGRRKAVHHEADFAVDVDVDVVLLGAALVVQHRRVGCYGGGRIEHRRQDFIGDVEQPAGGFSGCLGFSDDRSNPLTDEPHDVVEYIRIVGIDQVVFV
jgi:hypothetical protein